MARKKSKRKKTRNKKLHNERIILSSILVVVAIFVLIMFAFSVINLNVSGDIIHSSLNTQVVSDSSAESTSTLDDQAQMLIVIGAVLMSLLGAVVFLGVKIHDRHI